MIQNSFVTPDHRPSVLPVWIIIWLCGSGIICTMDVAYTMNRPFTNDRSRVLPGTIFSGWLLYSSVDNHYNTTNDLLTCSTGRLMLLECFLNFLSVGLAMARSRHAILLTFSTTLMVLWKTILFFSFFIGIPEQNPNAFNENKGVLQTLLIFWIPNGVWVVVPIIVLITLWNKLALPPKVSSRYWKNHNKCLGDIDLKKQQ